MSNALTCESIRAGVEMIKAVAETIRDLGSIESGTLYAVMMGSVDLEQYNRIIDILKNAELVKESSHILTWVGPTLERSNG